ncbi:hypothetical protein AZJ74_03355 [Streptococcus pneumoniae]|nr:hypothetical protein AZJ74_03355 [Streptococcus pneumoniae]
MKKTIILPMMISVNYKCKEEAVAQELTYFLKEKVTISERKKKFLNDLLTLSVENILTTNYSFDTK